MLLDDSGLMWNGEMWVPRRPDGLRRAPAKRKPRKEPLEPRWVGITTAVFGVGKFALEVAKEYCAHPYQLSLLTGNAHWSGSEMSNEPDQQRRCSTMRWRLLERLKRDARIFVIDMTDPESGRRVVKIWRRSDAPRILVEMRERGQLP